MQGPYKYDIQAATTLAGNESAFDSELNILRDVLKLLPTGVTVQDERGDFLLVNDAAAALLQMAAAAPPPSQLTDRRETCLELLRSGRAAVLEEAVTMRRGQNRVSHRAPADPDRRVATCCSRVPPTSPSRRRSRITLFRSAYYDELTGLPTRRVIEHRVNTLLHTRQHPGPFRAGLSRRR